MTSLEVWPEEPGRCSVNMSFFHSNITNWILSIKIYIYLKSFRNFFGKFKGNLSKLEQSSRYLRSIQHQVKHLR